MPEFENNFYSLQDYHDEQLRHYGLKRDNPPDPLPQPVAPKKPQQDFIMNEATGMPVPVTKGEAISATNVQPATRSSSPARPPRTQSPDKTRKIYRGQDGRFDASTIHLGDSRPSRVYSAGISISSSKSLFVPFLNETKEDRQ